MNNLKYYFSKINLLLHPTSTRGCHISKTSKIGYYSNLINVKIGKYTYLGNYNSICNTEIGSFCSIASFCSIGGGNHDYSRLSTSPIFEKGKNVFKKNLGNLDKTIQEKVVIGNDCWIGEKVFIKPGVVIGDGAIVGAHSVVTKDVLPYSIVAGCPAKIIKFRFSDDVCEKLLKIKWWSMTDEELKRLSTKICNVDDFIKEVEKNEI